MKKQEFPWNEDPLHGMEILLFTWLLSIQLLHKNRNAD